MKISRLLLAAFFLSASPLFAAEPPAAAPTTVPANAVKIVTIDEAQKLLQTDPKIVVIDVRTADEFQAGHIAGAKNLNIMDADFAKQIAALDKDTAYLVHCAAGGRSARACAVPEVLKLKTVYHMNEGFKAWEKAGKPVEKTAPAK